MFPPGSSLMAARFLLFLSDAVFRKVLLLEYLDGVEEVQVMFLYIRLSLPVVPVEFHRAWRNIQPVECQWIGKDSDVCTSICVHKPFPENQVLGRDSF
ncbi:hypothetical protein SRM_00211 [Salinibacter ruber M8]|uniref:Uncharacterized protein n=2 Tax=Salinibacter ruber TaxID=146919 RepID=D5H527_SALRM|nr:hypothetical protein SRM_00211 [Salinibacter ruber M8]